VSKVSRIAIENGDGKNRLKIVSIVLVIFISVKIKKSRLEAGFTFL
jgi:hypothetical protein